MLSRIRTYRIIPAFLTLLFFIGTTGFSMDAHLCQGTIKTVNLIGKASDCASMAKKVKSSHCKKKLEACQSHHEANSDSGCEKGCCDQKTIVSQMDVDIAFQVENAGEHIACIAVQETVPPFFKLVFDYGRLTCFDTDHPPPSQPDNGILYQSFLL